MSEAWDLITSRYPKFRPVDSRFTAKMDKYGRLMVKLIRGNSIEHPFFGRDGRNKQKTAK